MCYTNIKRLKKAALRKRMEHFENCDCETGDHGPDYRIWRILPEAAMETILQKALAGEVISREEAENFKTDLLIFCAEVYAKPGWVLPIDCGFAAYSGV